MLLYFSLLASFSAAQAALTYSGVDWSSLLVEEAAGHTFKNAAGTTQPLETILKNSGVNSVAQRLWVNPAGGNYDLAYNIKLAKRAQAAGLSVYLDMHLSDTWADPGHQAIPSGWPTDYSSLSTYLQNYTLSVCNTFESNGIPLTMISIGNEIQNGILTPTGAASNGANLAGLLHAASAGIKASKLSPTPLIMIHVANGWDWGAMQKWYTSVLSHKTFALTDFDVIGVTYYPFYGSGATLAALKSCLTQAASTWSKQVAVAETDWPISCPKSGHAFPSDVASIPYSPDGQATWLKDIASVLSGIKGGAGLYYWEPAWLDDPKLGSSCANNLMFDSTGKALSSVAVFASI